MYTCWCFEPPVSPLCQRAKIRWFHGSFAGVIADLKISVFLMNGKNKHYSKKNRWRYWCNVFMSTWRGTQFHDFMLLQRIHHSFHHHSALLYFRKKTSRLKHPMQITHAPPIYYYFSTKWRIFLHWKKHGTIILFVKLKYEPSFTPSNELLIQNTKNNLHW